jgi:hypothetical protein
VPELPCLVLLAQIELVFESVVAAAEQLVEGGFIGELREVEGFAGREDDGLFGEVAVVGVVEAV